MGRGPAPSLVIGLVEGLPDDSMFIAENLGGLEYMGWGHDRYMLAELIDATYWLGKVTGNWGKKPPKIPPHWRPEDIKKAQQKKKVSLADLHRRLSAGS